MNQYLDISDEVQAALSAGEPVVALESTIISHGMPWPQNLETARAVEAVIRDAGATPATIAIIDGRLKAGLSPEELETLARKGPAATKASRRDFPRLLAEKGLGATTVAGTMIVASMAGIKIFATGGIGGVHRGAETTWDVSADLVELARTDTAVVCAGAKSILDLAKTLEFLETRGVPVIGYRTSELPAFYTSHSGLVLEERADSPQEIAAMLTAKWAAGLSGGVVVANPIPEQYSLPQGVVNPAIEQSVAEAEKAGIKGKQLTPYLLKRISEITGGESLESNIALVKNNARLAAEIAIAYAQETVEVPEF
ncbi:MAG: pseudouridine-5'-phosphate glycosidase [Spirochaetaceae bacterium]|nr:pseudouridine-5'-phosphate glycosidase [Spirochaetaceae bacterium]